MSEPAPSVYPEPSEFEKMAMLAQRVVSVPKAEVDRREVQWKKDRGQTNAQKKREARR